MPILQAGEFEVEYLDSGGAGPVVLLLPGSAGGIRQWRSLIESAQGRYRFLAVNLFGYGRTSRWPDRQAQTLADQASLALAAVNLPELSAAPVTVIGHSFGGAVAIQLALMLGRRLRGLVMFEPASFHLLGGGADVRGLAEGRLLRDQVKRFGASGQWEHVARVLTEYWGDDDAWAELPQGRREALAVALAPNFFEWDCLYPTGDGPPPPAYSLEQVGDAAVPVMLMTSSRARPAVGAIHDLLRRAYPQWTFATVLRGGHMAPITHPDVVNPLLLDFLDGLPD